MPGDQPVLEAVDVGKEFPVHDRFGGSRAVRAVEHANLALYPGRITALVGESGSGKTTLARLLALFHPPTSGEIRLDGLPVTAATPRGEYHSAVQLVFQDPFAALNSLHRARYMLRRALQLHGRGGSRAEVERASLDLLRRVNLTPPERILDSFPHQLSGGQRQRLVIARALAVQPRVLLADEPISMLDVSIRLDVLNLLATLRDEQGLAMLYITHDIASARYLADTVHVMYAGQTVEGGPRDSVILQPKHPYTRLLLDSSPDPARSMADGADDPFAGVAEAGEPPNLADPPPGCRFHPRCPFAMDECRREFPARTTFADGGWAHCWLHRKGRTGELLADVAVS
ncbi:ABC transporter ATP-binding protein [Actinocatenispora rupis]|uniref:Dipeptide/oligopeptide/nickel ABC transporter ATP-binding protein n=1 Tax=Actinocatenispora rupis TaxID=519421 RepID=A0A8J3NCG0_9ACTN|nr:ABC transporter ATP-binding protein [Actinocatenispora rupis]GID10394.1 dipeptide/oligopeptide/nickel ABC transporter ATP-binding protein [Actinocatenispora rupis]